MCKLFVLDRNTWNHRIVSKLFVLDRNTWYHTTMCKQKKGSTAEWENFLKILFITAIPDAMIQQASGWGVFHSSINRWSFTGVWVTAKFLSSSGFFDVFCQMVLILPLISSCSIPLFEHFGTVPSSQLQLVSLSPSCSTAFLVLRQGPSICLFFCFVLFSFCCWPEQPTPPDSKFFFFFFVR